MKFTLFSFLSNEVNFFCRIISVTKNFKEQEMKKLRSYHYLNIFYASISNFLSDYPGKFAQHIVCFTMRKIVSILLSRNRYRI